MSIDKGSNQLHYMTPPYKNHVELSLYRGARSGMGTPRTAASPPSSVGFTRDFASMAHTRSPRTAQTTFSPLAAAAPRSIVPARYLLHSLSPRLGRTPVGGVRKSARSAANDGDADRPWRDSIGPFMSIDKGSNQVHYMKPPYAPHVELSLYRGARSGMDTCSRRRAGR